MLKAIFLPDNDQRKESQNAYTSVALEDDDQGEPGDVNDREDSRRSRKRSSMHAS
jgi:hypothetical protein